MDMDHKKYYYEIYLMEVFSCPHILPSGQVSQSLTSTLEFLQLSRPLDFERDLDLRGGTGGGARVGELIRITLTLSHCHTVTLSHCQCTSDR